MSIMKNLIAQPPRKQAVLNGNTQLRALAGSDLLILGKYLQHTSALGHEKFPVVLGVAMRVQVLRKL